MDDFDTPAGGDAPIGLCPATDVTVVGYEVVESPYCYACFDVLTITGCDCCNPILSNKDDSIHLLHDMVGC